MKLIPFGRVQNGLSVANFRVAVTTIITNIFGKKFEIISHYFRSTETLSLFLPKTLKLHSLWN